MLSFDEYISVVGESECNDWEAIDPYAEDEKEDEDNDSYEEYMDYLFEKEREERLLGDD